MNNTLKIMNYKNHHFDTGIPMGTIRYLDVNIISGDEVVIALTDDGVRYFDAAVLANNLRCESLCQGMYTVFPDQFEKWNKRKTVYDPIDKWDFCV